MFMVLERAMAAKLLGLFGLPILAALAQPVDTPGAVCYTLIRW